MNTPTVYNIIAKNNRTKESVITATAAGWKNVLDKLSNIIFEKSGEGWKYNVVGMYTFPHYIARGAQYITSVSMVKFGKEKGDYESYFLYIKKATPSVAAA